MLRYAQWQGGLPQPAHPAAGQGASGGGGGAGGTIIWATCSTRRLALSSAIATVTASLDSASHGMNAMLRPGFSSRKAPSAKRPMALVVSTTHRAVALVVSSTVGVPSTSLTSATTAA